MREKDIRVGLTYDDVVLVPAKSEVLPSETDTRTRLSRNVTINIPIVSAAMDTVTETRLAIAPDQTIRDAHQLMSKYRISGIPVTKNGKLVGILTNRDLRFENRIDLKVSQ